MSQAFANLAVEGGDPRDPAHPIVGQGNSALETQLICDAHDSSVSFEEYVYYASITRAEEKQENERHIATQGPKNFKSMVKNRFSNYKAPTAVAASSPVATDNDSNGEKKIEEKREGRG